MKKKEKNMATYYSAYLAKKTNDGIYEIIGPYVLTKDNEVRIKCLWWRSQSFIRWNEWESLHIPVEKLGEEAAKLCAEDSVWSDDVEKKYSIGYWIPAKEIYRRGSCEPIRGYLPVEEAAALIRSGYDQDFISWSMEQEPISAEVLAGMSDSRRNEYSFVSYIDYESTRYHMWELGRILNGYESYDLIEDGEELGVIFQVG